MNEITELQKAYSLIKARDFLAARPIVMNVLKHNPQNVDAWWLAVYVVDTPQDKMKAVRKVLLLNPQHQAAQEMCRRLEKDLPAAAPPPQLQPLVVKNQVKRQSTTPLFMYLIALGFFVFTLAVLYDNFSGENIFGFLAGEPEAVGYVDDDGGAADENEGIPIVKEQEANMGSMVTDTVFRGQAHRYTFYATAGDTILVSLMFSKKAGELNEEMLANALYGFAESGPTRGPENLTLELWNDRGHRVTTGRASSIPGAVELMYDVPFTGHYSLVITGREEYGNYFVYVNKMDDLLEEIDGYESRGVFP
jgi:hypothetical protein